MDQDSISMTEVLSSAIRLSQLGARVHGAEPVITHLMSEALSRPSLLSIAAGFTDNAVLPVDLVSEVVSRVAAKTPSNEHLQYGVNQGRPGLRRQVLKLLSSYSGETSLPGGIEHVIISNGSQQSLYLSAQLLCDPGDIVLVEAPSYFVFLELLKGQGLRPVSMPTFENGRVDFEGLEALFQEWERSGEIDRVRLLYFMGVYANPSARCWLEEDKIRLAEVLRRRAVSIPVIEDSAYRELYFDAPWPARTILSLPEWNGLPAMFAGTFTKPFASGMKVGFAVSHHSEWIRDIGRIKGHQDFGTSNFLQAIIEEVCVSGEYYEHLERVRPSYKNKMNAMDSALRDCGLDKLGWSWERPEGGLLMWVRAPQGFDTSIDSRFCETCLYNEVIYVPGNLCFAEDTPKNFVRLSFGVLGEADLREAVRRFVTSVKDVS